MCVSAKKKMEKQGTIIEEIEGRVDSEENTKKEGK